MDTNLLNNIQKELDSIENEYNEFNKKFQNWINMVKKTLPTEEYEKFRQKALSLGIGVNLNK